MIETLTAPDFTLPTSDGQTFRLSTHQQGQKHIVLVFNRGFT